MNAEEKYFLYIIWSEKLNKYYIGSSSNPEKRLSEHNIGKANFTRKGIPWQMKYIEQLGSKEEGQKREREIKRMKSRTYIEHLIKK